LLRRAVGETVTLRLDLAHDPATSHADATHFQSAMLNLLINARDAMPGGGEVAISTRVVGSESGQDRSVVVCVRDGGAGMTPEVAARAFEPFFTTKDVGKGSGLGLSQVYGFARQSGGHASIAATPGQGTAVSIVLPAVAPPAHRSAQPDPTAETPGERAEMVLLAEDDIEVLATVREQVTLGGWRVVTATDGKTALEMLEANRDIAVLVTDVMMPGGMSGVELARAAAKARPSLAILLISGYPDAVLAEQGASEGEFDLLCKPFSQEQIGERIVAAIATRRRETAVSGGLYGNLRSDGDS
jgi:CheY-like chemotaxis protein